MLEQILRECPQLTRDDVLQIAASAGFDLLDPRLAPSPDPGDTDAVE